MPKKLLVCSCFNVRVTGLTRKFPGRSLRTKPYAEHLQGPFCSGRRLSVKLDLSTLLWFSLIQRTSFVLYPFQTPLAYLDLLILWTLSPHAALPHPVPLRAWHRRKTHLKLGFKQEFSLFPHFLIYKWGDPTYLTAGIRWNNKSMLPTEIVLKGSFLYPSPLPATQAPNIL